MAWPSVSVSSVVAGAGMHVPPKVVPNSYFETYLETSDEWITERTGIKERYWAEPGVTTSEIAEPAAREAIANAGLSVADIDGIVFATVTPDNVFPGSACVLQKRLGTPQTAFAFDINAVCSGFVYALIVADSLIASGLCKHCLVVGADIFTKLLDKKDRSTCVLFGDGAGAVVLSRAEGVKASGAEKGFSAAGSSENLRGIYCSEMHSDGSGGEILQVKNMRGGGIENLTPEKLLEKEFYLTMAGKEVFKLAVRALAEVNLSVIKRAGLEPSQVNYFVSHQANKRILDAMAKSIGAPEEKVLCNVDRYGNTSAATVPLLLAEASKKGIIKKGDLLALSAFGGGLTWGAALLRW